MLLQGRLREDSQIRAQVLRLPEIRVGKFEDGDALSLRVLHVCGRFGRGKLVVVGGRVVLEAEVSDPDIFVRHLHVSRRRLHRYVCLEIHVEGIVARRPSGAVDGRSVDDDSLKHPIGAGHGGQGIARLSIHVLDDEEQGPSP